MWMALIERKLEMEAWQDLATIYANVGSLLDVKACVDKAQLIEFFPSRSWHITEMFANGNEIDCKPKANVQMDTQPEIGKDVHGLSAGIVEHVKVLAAGLT